jgi:DNA helicase MCM8
MCVSSRSIWACVWVFLISLDVVGDPGMGKSQMLQALITLAPRGVYVCGNTASATGLTVTLVRDPVTGEQALEAGALVLSDQGVCCIDEFDKMGTDHQALLEAMEQQRISIAKAGIVSSLSARASVIAAANPAAGHYNKGKTIVENLRMTPALLSRFDLIFILVDRPNALRDRQLSDHVMAMHGGGGGLRASAGRGFLRDAEPDTVLAHRAPPPPFGGDSAFGSDDEHLDTRLRRAVAAIPPSEFIPPSLLKKYVAYARRYCHPAMTPAAAAILQSFYLSLRRAHGTSDSTPITTRQLESLIRLSEARAKMELRDWVTEADATDVVDLMRESLFDAATDEFGCVQGSSCFGDETCKACKDSNCQPAPSGVNVAVCRRAAA